MRAEIKEWTDALRSGEFEQGRSLLVTEDGKYCCLGVKCELEARKGNLIFDKNMHRYVDSIDRDYVYEYVLPTEIARRLFNVTMADAPRRIEAGVFEWGNLTKALQEQVEEYYNPRDSSDFPMVTLATLNDVNCPFDLIADVIEHI
jgi:hypothetical protein